MLLEKLRTARETVDLERPTSLDGWLAGDCNGLNFFRVDHALRQLLPLYMDA